MTKEESIKLEIQNMAECEKFVKKTGRFSANIEHYRTIADELNHRLKKHVVRKFNTEGEEVLCCPTCGKEASGLFCSGCGQKFDYSKVVSADE